MREDKIHKRLDSLCSKVCEIQQSIDTSFADAALKIAHMNGYIEGYLQALDTI